MHAYMCGCEPGVASKIAARGAVPTHTCLHTRTHAHTHAYVYINTYLLIFYIHVDIPMNMYRHTYANEGLEPG